MSLYEIDHDATRRRLDAVTAGGLRALSECARRSAEVDKQVRDLRERQERAKQDRTMQAADKPARQGRPARPGHAAQPNQAEAPVTKAPDTTPEPGVLKLGAPEDREPAETPPKPRPRRPAPASDGDDDLSGRTWLR